MILIMYKLIFQFLKKTDKLQINYIYNIQIISIKYREKYRENREKYREKYIKQRNIYKKQTKTIIISSYFYTKDTIQVYQLLKENPLI